MERIIKNTLSRLSEKEELVVYSAGIDLDHPVDNRTAERIKARTWERLGIVRPQKRFAGARLAVAVCITVALAVVSVCAASAPLRDRVIKIFNGHSEESESRVYPYLESPEYTPTRRPIEQTVDFSEIDLSHVDSVVVTSGRTGEVKSFYECGELVEKIKELKGHSPESSRGRSGFSYWIKLYCGSDELLELGLFATDGENLLFWGVFEEFRGIEYRCVYISDETVGEIVYMLDEAFGGA